MLGVLRSRESCPSVRPCGVTATLLVFHWGLNSGDSCRRMRTARTSSRRQCWTSYVSVGSLCIYIYIYIYIRYAVTNVQRLFEERRMGMAFSVFSDVLGMVTISVFSQFWEVDPWMAMYGHTLSSLVSFTVSVLAMALRNSGATFKGWVFLAFYNVVSAMLLMCYLSSFACFTITKHSLKDDIEIVGRTRPRIPLQVPDSLSSTTWRLCASRSSWIMSWSIPLVTVGFWTTARFCQEEHHVHGDQLQLHRSEGHLKSFVVQRGDRTGKCHGIQGRVH